MLKKLTAALMTLTLMLTVSGCFFAVPGKPSLYQYETTGKGRSGNSAYKGTSSFDPSYYPYFSMLGPGAQDAYSMIYDGLYSGQTSIKLSGGMSAQDVKDAFNMVLLDHPELFWVRTDFNYSYVEVTGAVTSAQFYFYDFASTPERLEQAKREFEAAANAIISGAGRLDTYAEKEVYIHDAINETCEFNVNARYSQSAYSALVLHSSVCAGYARAFQYLMQQLGVPTYFVIGWGGELHAWNIIKLDDEYYNVDCTWDDTDPKTYDFFNVSDRKNLMHSRMYQSRYLPACNGTKYSGLESTAPNLKKLGAATDKIYTDKVEYANDLIDLLTKAIASKKQSADIKLVISRELFIEWYRAFFGTQYQDGANNMLSYTGEDNSSLVMMFERLDSGDYLITHHVDLIAE